MTRTYYARAGLFFERHDDGSVTVATEHVTRESSDTPVRVTLGPEAWASCVAAMSLAGDNHETYGEAWRLHTGKEE